jgi:metal-sulfur cluster biosynthetic enzyme
VATEEQIREALRQVAHPEVKRDSVEMGTARGLTVQGGTATVTGPLPLTVQMGMPPENAMAWTKRCKSLRNTERRHPSKVLELGAN